MRTHNYEEADLTSESDEDVKHHENIQFSVIKQDRMVSHKRSKSKGNVNIIERCDDISLKYRLGYIFEQGEHGKIYNATNLKTGQEVVLKMVKKTDIAY